MKFFIIEVDATGETIGCELTRRKAIEYAQDRGYTSQEVNILVENVPVTAESVRRLLGQLGGYANN